MQRELSLVWLTSFSAYCECCNAERSVNAKQHNHLKYRNDDLIFFEVRRASIGDVVGDTDEI